MYTSFVEFEWDPAKARANLRKHHVEFADATAVFDDEDSITIADEDSAEEDRWVTIGLDAFGRVLVVVYTWRDDNVRLISARKASRHEREEYEE